MPKKLSLVRREFVASHSIHRETGTDVEASRQTLPKGRRVILTVKDEEAGNGGEDGTDFNKNLHLSLQKWTNVTEN